MKTKVCKRCKGTFGPLGFNVHDCIVHYPDAIRRELSRLWFVFGNNGPKCTMDNHKFIQRHIEGRGHEARFYKPTAECKRAVRAAIASRPWKEASE